MKPVPSNIVRTLEIEVPQFVKIVNETEANSIMLMTDAFAGEPDLFYNCVWYATSRGKEVRVVPDQTARP